MKITINVTRNQLPGLADRFDDELADVINHGILAAIEAAIVAGFAGPEVRQLYEVFEGPAAVLRRLRQLRPGPHAEAQRL